MSLRVQQLNGDTTFFLTFSPSTTNDDQMQDLPGTFTILIDPWLRGPSTILHPSFSISHHTSTPSIPSLADLNPLPHLVLISQDKPDHCHKETLCTLPPNAPVVGIVATSAAAKKIRSWKHFEAERVRVVKSYSARNAASVVKLPISPGSEKSDAGEITIANIPAKRDVTGLHNAIGITYRPPRGGTVLSVLYTPHGLPSSTLTPYIQTHLIPLNALPLTALFHSVYTEENPWWLGGRVAAGAPGGVKLVKMLGAKAWFAAHDEVKESTGLATKWIRSCRFEKGDVAEMLEQSGVQGTRVYGLDVGEIVVVPRAEGG